MSEYLDGLDRGLVHKVWLLKQEARRNGRRDVSLLSIINALLADALADMDALRERFCKPKEA